MANITDVKLPDNSQYDLKDNVSGYASKVLSATTDDLASLTATGDLADSGKKLSDLVLKSDVVDNLISTATNKPLSANQGRLIDSALGKRNIVINWDFTHPINETGVTSGTFAPVREILGKWETDYSGDGSRTYAITSQGLQINNDQAAVGFVKQTFETALDASKTYTLTIEFSDNHKETVTGDLTSLLYTEYYSGVSLQCTDTYVQLRIQASMGATVARIKVEPGLISTLIHDVAPNQTLETIKCQRADFRSVSSIQATGSTNTTGAQINAGTFFYLNGTFCKALTNIAVNATFTLNTNFEVATVGGEISSINDNLSKKVDVTKTADITINPANVNYATTLYKILQQINFAKLTPYSMIIEGDSIIYRIVEIQASSALFSCVHVNNNLIEIAEFRVEENNNSTFLLYNGAESHFNSTICTNTMKLYY